MEQQGENYSAYSTTPVGGLSLVRDMVDVRSVEIDLVVVVGCPSHDDAAHDGWNLRCRRWKGEYRKRASNATDSIKMLEKLQLQSQVWLTLTNAQAEHGMGM